jgi:hypothetical protein
MLELLAQNGEHVPELGHGPTPLHEIPSPEQQLPDSTARGVPTRWGIRKSGALS